MVKYTIREGGRTTMKKARYRSGDTQGLSATNEKITRDIAVTQKGGEPLLKKARDIAFNTQKWEATNEKRARDISVDTQKWGATNEKRAQDIAVDTQKESAPTNKKIPTNISADTQKGSVASYLKKPRNISVFTASWGDTGEKKLRDIAIDTQKDGDPLMKKARDIAFNTQKWGATDDKKAKDIAVDTQKWKATNDKRANDISSAQKVVEPMMNKARDISVNTQKAAVSLLKKVKDISLNTLIEPIVKKARVISVVTQKGGVGKTATAINMSVGLHNLGYKVAAIDLDPQGQLAEGFGIDRKSLKKTMFDVLLGKAHMKSIKQSAYGVDLYLSNRSLADLVVTVQTPPNLERYPNPNVLLKQALAQIDTKYDFIIIDTPPTVSIFNTNALNASTDAVIPMQPEGMAVKCAEDMLEFIREVQKSSNNNLSVLGILATMVQNTNLHNTVMQEIRRSFIKTDVTVFNTIIKRTIRYGSAQTDGVPDTKNFPEYTEFLKEALFSETA